MRDLDALIVRQSRLFKPDVLPIIPLQSASGLDIFQKSFGFRDSVPDANTGELWFGSGLFALSGRQVAISQATVGAQRFVVEVSGDSDTASSIFQAMAEVLEELAPGSAFGAAEPLLLTQETACVVTLEFSWDDLISSGLARFMSSRFTSEEPRPQASPRLSGMNLRFTLQYDISDGSRDFGIPSLDRFFIIEPRQNTPFSERRYFTFSPLDSDRHIELIAELETLLGGQSKKRRR